VQIFEICHLENAFELFYLKRDGKVHNILNMPALPIPP